jgi:hypothetical protein
VPPWIGGRLHGDHVARDEEAWVDLLARWHQGDDVSMCAFAEACKWSKGKTMRFMPLVAAWARENGATLPDRWADAPVADQSSDRKRTTHVTAPTEEQPAQSVINGPESDQSSDRKRTASRARDLLSEREEIESREDPDDRAAPAARPQQAPLIPGVAPTPKPPKPEPAPKADKPTKLPKADKPKVHGYKASIAAFEAEWLAASGHPEWRWGTLVPWRWKGHQPDGGRVTTWCEVARISEDDPASGVERVRNAARAYLAAVIVGRAYPFGEPPSVEWFTRHFDRWLQTSPDALPARPSARASPDDTRRASLAAVERALAELEARGEAR